MDAEESFVGTDRRAHFLTMLGDVCIAAGLAGIPIELGLCGGERLTGTPSAQPATETTGELDGTGYRDRLLIDGSSTQLKDVVSFAVQSP
jgi:hypothetical protein